MLKRFLDSNEMCNMSINDIAEEMGELNAASMTLTFRDSDDKPLAGVILVAGENVQEYLDAIDKVSEEEDECESQ
ncbi:hypothetical protein ABXV18_24620 [Vibrio owensii]|uniref:hypothetical protein n=1 Tax=Vibrio owensii TaxID=696485 RepID=UPI003393D86B